MSTVSNSAAGSKIVAQASVDAPWLVLVHGISQNHQVFDRQVEAFADDYRIALIDLPGHGLSTHINGPYGPAEFAGSIAAALDDLNIDHFHYWGTHLGASAGLLLAFDHPRRVTSLILEAPVYPGRILPSVVDLLDKVAEAARRQGIEAARDIWWREGRWFDVIRANSDQCRAAQHWAIISEFEGKPWLDAGLASKAVPGIDAKLAELATPVLIINGEHDLEGFIEAASSLTARLPNSRRAQVPRAGGFPLWEFPVDTNGIARAFLEEVG